MDFYVGQLLKMKKNYIYQLSYSIIDEFFCDNTSYTDVSVHALRLLATLYNRHRDNAWPLVDPFTGIAPSHNFNF